MATAATAGSHPLIDVSGPSSTINNQSADSYEYCVVRTAGECHAGSSVGQIYMNAPGIVYPYCSGTASNGGSVLGVGNDICISNMASVANMLDQYSLTQPDDYYGAYTRHLVDAIGRLRMISGFATARLLPDKSWILSGWTIPTTAAHICGWRKCCRIHRRIP